MTGVRVRGAGSGKPVYVGQLGLDRLDVVLLLELGQRQLRLAEGTPERPPPLLRDIVLDSYFGRLSGVQIPVAKKFVVRLERALGARHGFAQGDVFADDLLKLSAPFFWTSRFSAGVSEVLEMFKSVMLVYSNPVESSAGSTSVIAVLDIEAVCTMRASGHSAFPRSSKPVSSSPTSRSK